MDCDGRLTLRRLQEDLLYPRSPMGILYELLLQIIILPLIFLLNVRLLLLDRLIFILLVSIYPAFTVVVVIIIVLVYVLAFVKIGFLHFRFHAKKQVRSNFLETESSLGSQPSLLHQIDWIPDMVAILELLLANGL